MRTPLLSLVALVVLMACPASAQEEGLGLDLSGDAGAQPGDTSEGGSSGEEGSGGEEGAVDLGLTLDVGSEGNPALLPRFVLLGLNTRERIGAPAWRRWVGLLREAPLRTGQVAPGPDPREALESLESGYKPALLCEQAECLREPAETLEADVLAVAHLEKDGRRWVLRLVVYDRDKGEVSQEQVSGVAPRDKRFLREGVLALVKQVRAVARPRALLKVRSNLLQAVVRVGDKVLGVGDVEARLPPGPVELVVEADGFDTFSRSLALAAGETKEVEALLMASGPAPEGPPEEPVVVVKARAPAGPSLFSRPTLYTALVGLAAAGLGVALAQSANTTLALARDADGDGVLDITRRQYLEARNQSMLSTALMAGGGAVAGGSVLWLVLVPASAPKAQAQAGAAGSGGAVHLVLNGRF